MYRNLRGNEFIEIIENDPTVEIIDVRTEGEFRMGHIPEATLMDVFSPDFQNKVNALDKDKKILIYCRSGARSAHVCSMLAHSGFKDLSNLFGGLYEWSGKLVTLA